MGKDVDTLTIPYLFILQMVYYYSLLALLGGNSEDVIGVPITFVTRRKYTPTSILLYYLFLIYYDSRNRAGFSMHEVS
jgi:hypothetical protein